MGTYGSQRATSGSRLPSSAPSTEGRSLAVRIEPQLSFFVVCFCFFFLVSYLAHQRNIPFIHRIHSFIHFFTVFQHNNQLNLGISLKGGNMELFAI